MREAGAPVAELRLVLAVARRECNAREAEELRQAAKAVRDWPLAVSLAEQHRLTAFLALNLTAHAPDVTPPDVLAALHQARLQIAAKALSDLAELGAVIAALAAAGVRALPFKGQMLSWAAYGDFTMRQSIDLDVVVRPGDLGVALATLAERGYRHSDGFSRVVEREIRRSFAQVTLLRLLGEQRWELDLHWRFASPIVPWDPPLEAVIARTTPVRIGAATLPQLAPADELLLQLLHAARHNWTSLESLVAVRELLARESVDGDALLGAARAVGGARAVVVGCLLAHRLVQAALPAAVQRAFTADAVARELVDDIEARILASRGVLPRDKLVLFRTIDRPADRARMLLVSAFYPTPREGEWLHLPDSLALLYWPLRLVRLTVLLVSRPFRR